MSKNRTSKLCRRVLPLSKKNLTRLTHRLVAMMRKQDASLIPPCVRSITTKRKSRAKRRAWLPWRHRLSLLQHSWLMLRINLLQALKVMLRTLACKTHTWLLRRTIDSFSSDCRSLKANFKRLAQEETSVMMTSLAPRRKQRRRSLLVQKWSRSLTLSTRKWWKSRENFTWPSLLVSKILQESLRKRSKRPSVAMSMKIFFRKQSLGTRWQAGTIWSKSASLSTSRTCSSSLCKMFQIVQSTT